MNTTRVRWAKLMLASGFAVTLGFAGCDSDDANTDGEGGDAGAASDPDGAGGGDGSGGDGTSGSGGAGTGSTSGDAGTAGMGGAECIGGELSTNCCDAEDDPCPVDWPNCVFGGGVEYCCDAEAGVRRSCYNLSDWIELNDEICLDCDGQSFGTGTCDECLASEIPECEEFAGPGGTVRYCSLEDDVCKASDAGYVISCEDFGQIVCTCDPDAD